MKFSFKPWMAILAFLVFAGIGTVAWLYGYYNSTRDAGIEQETMIVAEYDANKSTLADAAISISESLGIADKSSEVTNVFKDAISGRYDNKMEGKGEGSLINALSVVEDSSDRAAVVANYSKVQDLVVAKRSEFKNRQIKLQDRAAKYKIWVDSGVVKSQMVKAAGFPSDRLSVTLADGTVITGKDALNKMAAPIVDQSTKDAFDTGIMKPTVTPKASK